MDKFLQDSSFLYQSMRHLGILYSIFRDAGITIREFYLVFCYDIKISLKLLPINAVTPVNFFINCMNIFHLKRYFLPLNFAQLFCVLTFTKILFMTSLMTIDENITNNLKNF